MSSEPGKPVAKRAKQSSWSQRILAIVGYGLWVALVFAASQALLVVLIVLLDRVGIYTYDPSHLLVALGIGVLAYVAMLAMTIGIPRWALKKATSLRELGLRGLMTWQEIGIALAGMVTYFVLTGVLLYAAQQFLPWIDIEQAQDLGLGMPSVGIEMAMAFLLLVVIAPFVEELLFRGYLFGKLRGSGVPFWLTALVVSLLFGIAHLQWNVGVDTFALSLVMCATREITGSLWPSVLMHMMKNGIAFYFLFVNPQAIQSLVG